MRTTILRALLSILFLATTATANAREIPRYAGSVNDTAGVLSSEAHQALTDRINAHKDRTGNQIVVLTMPSLEGEDIEGYAVRVFESWKPGNKGKDNGILVVVATKDRRVRIEVGYGLEGTLPDSAAGEIIRKFMTPRFKQGDFSGGIAAGVAAVIDVLAKGNQAVDREEEGPFGLRIPHMTLTRRILHGVFIFGILGLFTWAGIVSEGGIGWGLYLFLIPFWVLFPTFFVGFHGELIRLGIYLVFFPIAKIWYDKIGRPFLIRKRFDRIRRDFAPGDYVGPGVAAGDSSSSSSDSSSSSSSSDSGSSSSSSDSGGSSGGGGASDSW